MPKSKETLSRVFVKTLGWRVTASTVTVVSTYLISGSFDAAWKVGTIDVIAKLTGHFIYEKLWTHCHWGYKEDADSGADSGAVEIEMSAGTDDIK